MSSLLRRAVITWFFTQLAADGAYFRKETKGARLMGNVLDMSSVASLVECGLKCTTLKPKCKSFNYIKETTQSSICETNNITKHSAPKDDFIKQPNSDYFEPLADIYNQVSNNPFGDGVWTLVARFSNADTKHWMEDQATWWYDKEESYGKTDDPGDNADMISEAFWLKNGNEFKITRSDDPTHTALLTTTGNCLGGKTFRAKMASYGEFRGSTSWSNYGCLGQCPVVYGGNYDAVEGFAESDCDGNIQTRNYIGFWCRYESGDGAVVMIGGGGSRCKRADHGIGVTEADGATFQYPQSNDWQNDFGNGGIDPSSSYSLNLWVR